MNNSAGGVIRSSRMSLSNIASTPRRWHREFHNGRWGECLQGALASLEGGHGSGWISGICILS